MSTTITALQLLGTVTWFGVVVGNILFAPMWVKAVSAVAGILVPAIVVDIWY